MPRGVATEVCHLSLGFPQHRLQALITPMEKKVSNVINRRLAMLEPPPMGSIGLKWGLAQEPFEVARSCLLVPESTFCQNSPGLWMWSLRFSSTEKTVLVTTFKIPRLEQPGGGEQEPLACTIVCQGFCNFLFHFTGDPSSAVVSHSRY